jgi:SAM-dependent methyltransferase
MSEAQTVLNEELAEPVSIDLAESASIDRETLRYWLTGDRYPFQGIDFALRITSFLGCHDALMVGCGQQLGYVDDSPQRRPDLHAFGRELYGSPEFAGPRYVRSSKLLEEGALDTLTIIDTCDHLTELEIKCLFAEANRLLKPRGYLIVRVPVGYGRATVSRKRVPARSRAAEHGVGDSGRVAKLSREATGLRFRFKAFRRLLAESFDIEKSMNQPWPRLPRWFNSRRIMLCQKREAQ